MVGDPDAGAFPFRWDPSYGARIGVLPLGGDGTEAVWHEIDPCYVFHGVNAYRDGDAVVLDVCRHESMFDGGTLGTGLALHRWTVDTAPGGSPTTSWTTAPDMELPSRDLRRTGRAHRHGYFVQNRPAEATVDLGGVIKHDYETGERTVWDPGATQHGDEWFFVADPGGDADDEGWLLSYVHDEATGRERGSWCSTRPTWRPARWRASRSRSGCPTASTAPGCRIPPSGVGASPARSRRLARGPRTPVSSKPMRS